MSRRAPRLLPLLAAALWLAACGTPEERAAAYVARAQALYEAGNLTGARLQAQNALQVEPKNGAARYLLALVYEQEGNLRETIGQLLVAVDADPGNLPALLKLGNLFFYAESFGEAARYAEAAAALAPDDPGVRMLRARLLFQRQDYPGGLAELDAVLAADPTDLDALSLKAIVLAREDVAAAIAFIDRSLPGVDPARTQALRRIRLSLVASSSPAAAVEAELKDLSLKFPGETFYPLELVALYRQQRRIDEAEALLRDLTAKQPGDVELRLALVQFLAFERSPEVAEDALKGFLAAQPDSPQLAQALGRRYEATGRTAEAIAVYREMARRSPKSVAGLAARREIAILAFREGRIDDGRVELASLLGDVPDDPDALVLRASLSADEGNLEAAIADLRSALRRQPEAQTALLLLARTYVRSGNNTLAAETYRRLLAVEPAHAEALAELPPVLVAQGDLVAASQVLEQRLQESPQDVLALGRLAELRLRQGAPAEAEALARRMMAAPDQRGLGEFVLGRSLRAQGQTTAAITAFRTSLAARPEDLAVRDSLVEALVAAGRAPEAIRQLQSDLAARPGDTPAKYLLAGIFARQGNREEALELLEAAIREQPTVATHYEALAGLASTPAELVSAYRRGHEAIPGDPGLALRLGEAYAATGQYDNAIRTFEALVAVNPGLPAAVNNLAALLLDHRSDRASWDRALQLARPLADSRNPLYLDTLGWAQYRTGAVPQAVRTLEQAVALNGQIPVLRYHLGMAYLAAGNEPGARQELAQAVNMARQPFPGLEEARSTLEGLDG